MKYRNHLSVRAIQNGIFLSNVGSYIELIQMIQKKEGNPVCFMTEKRMHCQGKCEWASLCHGEQESQKELMTL